MSSPETSRSARGPEDEARPAAGAPFGIGRLIRAAALALLALSLITGIVYPLAVTGVARLVFPRQAQGSLVQQGGRVVGSSLIGQSFDDPAYFWSRPSATAPFPYNAAAGAGSNYGPLNPDLLDRVQRRVMELRAADPRNTALLPIDLVTSSAGGLDPHISPAAAEWQVPRVARARGVSESAVRHLVLEHTAGRQLGFLGEPRVNVLELNLALDALAKGG
jgi:K+-transporting ATPase ATPase C chain